MEPQEEKKKLSVKGFCKGLLRELIVPIFLAILVIQYVIQAFQIPSGSMEDSLKTGDFLLGLKFTYGSPIPFSNQKFPGFTSPEAGDVIIFRYPGEPEYPDGNPGRYTHLFNALMFGNFYWDHEPQVGQSHLVHFADGPKDYIKRCVGVSGDTIAIHGGRLYVNGVLQSSLPGKGKYTASVRTKSPRDERNDFVVPSVGDTIYVDSVSLEMAWWLHSLVSQENPDETVELNLTLLQDGKEVNDYVFEDFKLPVENDRRLLIDEIYRNNRTVFQHVRQGDTVSARVPFSYFKELTRMAYLPLFDPKAESGLMRQVSYIGFDGSLLQDLEGNVDFLNAGPSVENTESAGNDSSATEASVLDSAAQPVDVSTVESAPKFEIRRTLTVGGKPIDSYVVQTPQFFMMGDNRDNSLDSRYWGFVSLRNIKAKAFVIYFSFENDDNTFALNNPFTWWRLPFKIRWSRLGKIIHLID